jgi:hypothetical protein
MEYDCGWFKKETVAAGKHAPRELGVLILARSFVIRTRT